MERDYTRHRKHHTGNLHLVKDLVLRGKMEIPQMLPFIGGIPTCLLPFNRAMTTKRQDCAVHFFLDDYQFERIWRQPEKYLPVLKRFQCSLSPDFSLFADMPLPLQIYNTYRNRLSDDGFRRRVSRSSQRYRGVIRVPSPSASMASP